MEWYTYSTTFGAHSGIPLERISCPPKLLSDFRPWTQFERFFHQELSNVDNSVLLSLSNPVVCPFSHPGGSYGNHSLWGWLERGKYEWSQWRFRSAPGTLWLVHTRGRHRCACSCVHQLFSLSVCCLMLSRKCTSWNRVKYCSFHHRIPCTSDRGFYIIKPMNAFFHTELIIHVCVFYCIYFVF